jgi:hypothetical protein
MKIKARAKAKQVELPLAPPRKIYEIAGEILQQWPVPYFGAQPYLRAMFSLSSLESMYGWDSAGSVVRYFLSNATYWRGPAAKRIKAELRAMLKAEPPARVAGKGLNERDPPASRK